MEMRHESIQEMISSLNTINNLILRFYRHQPMMTKEEKALQKQYQKQLKDLSKKIGKFEAKIWDDFYSKKYRF